MFDSRPRPLVASVRRALLLAPLAAGLVAWPPAPVRAQEAHRDVLRSKFVGELEAIARDFDGVFGATAVDLSTGHRIDVHGDWVFPQGSAIKIPILLELFRRAEERPGLLNERRTVTATVQTGGSGVLEHFGDGSSELALGDLTVLMIVLSDNTATNVLIDAVGMEGVNTLMRDLGADSVRLRRKMIRPASSARGDENIATPDDAADLMARLHRCDLPFSEERCRRVREILEIGKGGPFRSPIPRDVPVAFKPGGIEGVATAWGLVALPDRPYALTVMTNYGGDGGAAIREASRAAWEYFRRLDRSTPYGARVPLDVIRERRDGRREGS